MTYFKKDGPLIHPKDIFIGHPKAPITLTEYGDYECEVGLHNDLIIREALKRYPGIVNFNYRHFPQLRIHQKAHKAAEAAIAAAQEGMFPQMHDLILHNRRNLGAASLAGYARELGMSGINFLDVLVAGKYGQYVQDDIASALKLGIKDAPAFFINGKRIEGRISVRGLCEQIDPLVDALHTSKPKAKPKKYLKVS